MEALKLDIENVISHSPAAWNDFTEFYKSTFAKSTSFSENQFKEFPFELQLGVFLKFFDENGVELDVCNAEFSETPNIIEEAFRVHEKVRGHFS